MLRKIITGYIVFTLIIFAEIDISAEAKQSEQKTGSYNGTGSYFKIVSLYQKLLSGLPGSRNFHVFEMKQYMDGLPGKEFTTDYDFSIVPDSNRLELQAIFPERRWMHIHCDNLPDAILNLKKKHELPEMQTWWRRGFFFAVSGTMKYYIVKTGSSVEVHVYLRDVKLLLLDNK